MRSCSPKHWTSPTSTDIIISKHERDIILHAKRSLLLSDECPWEKNLHTTNPMQSWDLSIKSWNMWVSWSLPIIPSCRNVWPKHRTLWRRRISSLQHKTTRDRKDKKKKKKINAKSSLTTIFKITGEANTTIVNFLDETLDLKGGKHYPYTKKGNIPLYVHKKAAFGNIIRHRMLMMLR